jgi:hypothetical protein
LLGTLQLSHWTGRLRVEGGFYVESHEVVSESRQSACIHVWKGI